MKRLLLSVFAITFAVTAVPICADPIYFTDRTAFDAATGEYLDFESFEQDWATPVPVKFFPGFTVTETLGANLLAQARNYPAAMTGWMITDGTGALWYDDNDNSIGTFFDFVSPVTAFGMDMSTNAASVVTIDGGDVSYNLNLGIETPSFWGVVDYDGIMSITIDASGGPNIGFDAASYGLAMIEVAIDIKFCSDPNAFNCKKKGVLPVTIFGTEDFDVVDIDISSLQLCTEDLTSCTNAPRDYSIADRGDPTSDLGAAICTINPDTGEEEDFLTQDEFLDLDAAFEASEVQYILGTFCSDVKGTTSEPLVITGTTLDGTMIFSVPFPNVGTDQLWKVNK